MTGQIFLKPLKPIVEAEILSNLDLVTPANWFRFHVMINVGSKLKQISITFGYEFKLIYTVKFSSDQKVCGSLYRSAANLLGF